MTRDFIDFRDCRRDVIADASYFYSRGWMMGTAGNLSARSENGFWITASGCNKGELGLINFVEVDLNGLVKRKFLKSAKPSAETSIHTAIYNLFPDTQACYHVHSVASVALSRACDADVMRINSIEMVKGFMIKGEKPYYDIPLFENHLDVENIARDISTRLSNESFEIPALMIKGHGVTVWGRSVSEVRNRVELIEFIFEHEKAI